MPEQERQLKVAEDIATLKGEVKNIHEKIDMRAEQEDKNHEELMDNFHGLRKKVNDEITTMNEQIGKFSETFSAKLFVTRKHFARALIIALALGSILWIKESRDWVLANIFRIL